MAEAQEVDKRHKDRHKRLCACTIARLRLVMTFIVFVAQRDAGRHRSAVCVSTHRAQHAVGARCAAAGTRTAAEIATVAERVETKACVARRRNYEESTLRRPSFARYIIDGGCLQAVAVTTESNGT